MTNESLVEERHERVVSQSELSAVDELEQQGESVAERGEAFFLSKYF